ncbi:LamG-like jellyroll fold domain-containing protein [Thalassomonas haliotis]|uniref:PKD domain-containing protein n=1 Tax=Thalassomonas haliotis TaxID=485448 RepID=A0ABY7VE87_9GAMM|nr:LamG-like jellyroll fold domain-containing protein [Thalassomonas haliotis]WDE11305.1 PKD domain-containing protein [Thalassomonas haliotis]
MKFGINPFVALTLLSWFLFSNTPVAYAAHIESVALISSRVSGPAPLAVHFDASEVILNGRPLDAIREVNYSWDFGDEKGQRWRTNQQAKNSDSGFVAGHLFETPGHYQVSVEITSKNGAFEPLVKSVVIEVGDADEIYAGENTVCFSMAGDFTACPENAQQVRLIPGSDIAGLLSEGKFRGSMQKQQRLWNPYKEYALEYEHNSTFEYLDYQQQWDCRLEAEAHKELLISAQQIAPFINSNKRLLFHRGESFTFYDSLYLSNFNGGRLGAFGACSVNSQGRCDNAPVLQMLAAERYSDLLILADGSTDIAVSDLAMTQVCADASRAINLYGSVNRVTFNKLEIEKFDTAVIGRTYGQRVPHDVIGIFNSKFEKLGAGNAEVYDPEDLTCESPAVPDWHNGDKKTALDESDWALRWQDYQARVLASLANPRCKSGGNIAYLPAHRHMILGSEMQDAATRRAEHVLRMPLAFKSVIAHNIFAQPSPNKHALKLHNQGDCLVLNDCDVNPVQSAENYPTAWVLIRENLFKADTDIVVNLGPGTSKVGEQVSHILFAGNRVEAGGSQNQFALVLSGHDSIVENNLLVQKYPTTSWVGVSVAKGRNEPEHAGNNRVNNNRAEVNGSLALVRLGEDSDGAVVSNNQVCAPGQVNFVDVIVPDVAYQAENNLADCSGLSFEPDNGGGSSGADGVDGHHFTAPLFHLNFDNGANPAMDVMAKVSAEAKGNIDLVAGVVGRAAAFDELSDEILIPDPMANIDNTGQFSLMFWLKASDFGSGGEAFGRPRLNRQGDVSLTLGEEGEVLFYLNAKHINPGIRLPQQEWSHLALTFDRAQRLAKVYLNGEERYQYHFPDSTEFFFNTSQEFRLGVGQWRSASSYFSGLLDEFKFYQQSLSADEIGQEFQAESPF